MRPLLALAFCCLATPVLAKPVAKPVEWEHEGVTFSGYLVYDDDFDGATDRPGIVMFPNWMGVTEEAVSRAKAVADDDYIVLLADVYGEDVRPRNPQEAGAATQAAYANRPLLRERAAVAVDVLRRHGNIAMLDKDRIGAIGFCFGGAVALELARAGADLDGVVSFHGNLETTMAAQPGVMKTPVLVLNGADDTFVSPASITAFGQEMRAVGADWQFVDFGGAMHCFAEPSADGVAVPGCKYDERAATRAYRMMGSFFSERFKEAD